MTTAELIEFLEMNGWNIKDESAGHIQFEHAYKRPNRITIEKVEKEYPKAMLNAILIKVQILKGPT